MRRCLGIALVLCWVASCGPDFQIEERGFKCDPKASAQCEPDSFCGGDGYCTKLADGGSDGDAASQ